MPPETVTGPFEIGSWRADPAANELHGHGDVLRIAPKAMAVLSMLQAERGEVVARTRLCDRVGLSDEGLSRTVSELRKVIETDPRAPAWLQTIPRRGYRLNVAPTSTPPRRRFRAGPIGWTVLVLGALAAVWWAGRPGPVDAPEFSLRRLTAFEGRAVSPRLEPGAVVFDRIASDGERLGLWRLELGTLALTPLDVDAGVRDRLTVDGRTVATLEARDGRCRIVLRDATLDCRDAGGGLDLHAGRGWIAFEDAGGGISRVGLDGTELRRLTDPPPGAIDRDPRFSPDAERVVFVRGDDVGSELHWVPAGGGPSRPVTDDGQMVFGHDWLDERRMIFSSDRAGIRELWLLPGFDRSPVALGGTWAMGLDADDGRVVFERPVYRADIVEARLDGARPLIESARYDNHPRLSPDGRRLAFLSNRTGHAAVWIADADGRGQRLLVEEPDVRLTRPRWLDDQTIVFAAFDRSGSEIRRVDLDGGTRELVGRRWSPLEAAGTGDRLWFIGRDEAGPAVFLRHADGRIVRRHALDARQLEVGAGGRLYVELSDRPGVFEPERDLTRPVARPLQARGWVVNGDYLAWVGSRGVLRRRLSDGTETLMSPLSPDVIGHGLEIGADGERLLIARTTGVQTDLHELRLR